MRFLRTGVSAGLLVLAASAADAGWLGSGGKLPKPISVLNISRPWDSSHAHPALRPHKYRKPGWGAQWKLTLRTNPYHTHPYIRGY